MQGGINFHQPLENNTGKTKSLSDRGITMKIITRAAMFNIQHLRTSDLLFDSAICYIYRRSVLYLFVY